MKEKEGVLFLATKTAKEKYAGKPQKKKANKGKSCPACIIEIPKPAILEDLPAEFDTEINKESN